MVKADIIILSSNVTCPRHDIAEQLLILALNNKHSLALKVLVEHITYYIANSSITDKTFNALDYIYE